MNIFQLNVSISATLSETHLVKNIIYCLVLGYLKIFILMAYLGT